MILHPFFAGIDSEKRTCRFFFRGPQNRRRIRGDALHALRRFGTDHLNFKRKVVEALPKGRIDLGVDLKPALSPEQVENRLIREFQEQPRQQIQSLLGRLLPKSLVPLILRRSEVSPEAKGGEIRVVERRKIRKVLKDWRLPVRGARPLEEAIVTAGGIAVREIQPSTLESRIVKGSIFAEK